MSSDVNNVSQLLLHVAVVVVLKSEQSKEFEELLIRHVKEQEELGHCSLGGMCQKTFNKQALQEYVCNIAHTISASFIKKESWGEPFL